MDHFDKNGNNLDFSQVREVPNAKRQRPWLRRLTIGLVVFLGIVFVGASLFAAIYYPRIKTTYDLGISARTDLEEAQHAIINRDLELGADLLSSANLKLTEAKSEFDSVPLIRWVPYARTQVKAVDALIIAGVNLTSSGEKLVNLGDDLTRNIRNESIPYSELSDEQKKTIVRQLVEAEPLLIEVQTEIGRAADAIAVIRADSLLKPLADVVEPLQQYLPVAKRMIDEALPMISAVPTIVGFDEEKTYLFLIQNNNELRPTGGFIGNYGIIKLKDGAIEELTTDNIYNLDRAFQDDEETLTPQQIMDRESPVPIRLYLEQRQWALRDANWDPDFPMTAQTAIEIFNEERTIAADIERQIYLREPSNNPDEFQTTYPTEEIDGVIAITPELIVDLLKITGPITVEGIRFTDENFHEELEFRVGFAFRELGIDESQRKEIIKLLADQIKARILSLPYTRLADVFNVAVDALQAKSILVYSSEADIQELILERGWGGEVNTDSTDYLFVVDTNLGSLKSDQYVDRFVNYTLSKDGADYVGRVTVTHRHNGEFTWNSTRLRSYTRVYVPLGSVLRDSSGAMLNDKTKDPEGRPGAVTVEEEHGRTVFGAFFVTEPGESNSLTFSYTLPPEVAQRIEAGAYNFMYQKQPGTTHELTVEMDFDKTIRNASPAGEVSGIFNDVYRHMVEVVRDTWVVVGF